MKRTMLTSWIVGLVLLAPAALWAQHAGDMLIGSTADGGGSLAIDYDFGSKIVVTPSFSGGGLTLYTATDPGFDVVLADRPGFYRLDGATLVRLEVVGLDAGVSFKVGSTTLDAPGESATIGTMPDLHVHPEWRLTLPDGVTGDYAFSFRLTTTSAAYGSSAVYTATITNAPPTTTTTTVPSGTTTTAASTTTTTSLPPGSGTPITGKKLLLKAKPGDATKKNLVVIAHDPGIALGSGNGSDDDPTRVGASVRLLSAADPFDATYPLPAGGWSLIGKPGQGKGYRYKDKTQAGPVKVAVVKGGKLLSIVGKGPALPHTLTVDPNPVDVVFSMGSVRLCLRFGGTTKLTAGKSFKAMNASSPGACPP
jgi:hypothetical protein